MRTGLRRTLLFRADAYGVTIIPDRREQISLPWSQIRRIFLSRQHPRRLDLVVLAEDGKYSVVVHERPATVRSGIPPVLCRFALLSDGEKSRYCRMEPVWLHLRDDRIPSSIFSVRP